MKYRHNGIPPHRNRKVDYFYYNVFRHHVNKYFLSNERAKVVSNDALNLLLRIGFSLVVRYFIIFKHAQSLLKTTNQKPTSMFPKINLHK